MGQEMKNFLVGPMPIDKFLEEFFPISKIQNYQAPLFEQNCYDETVSCRTESAAYIPFVSAMYPHCPFLIAP